MPKSAPANGATKAERSAQPRSPPLCADPGSWEYCWASSPKSFPAFASASTFSACASAAASSLPEKRHARHVGRAQVRIACRHLRLERSQRELRILEVRGLRGHVLRLVSLVVGLHGGIVDAGGGLEALHRQHEVAHLALLPLELGEPRALSRREKSRGADAALELGAPRLGAQVPLVVGERDAGLGEHAFGGLRGKLAADLEGRLLLHRLAQRLGTHPVAETLRALSDQRLADHAFEHLVLEALAELRRNLHSSESLLPLSLLADPAVVRLFEGDLGAVRLGGIVGPTEVQVHDAVGAPGGEHERQRPEYQVREPLLALQGVSDSLQHL